LLASPKERALVCELEAWGAHGSRFSGFIGRVGLLCQALPALPCPTALHPLQHHPFAQLRVRVALFQPCLARPLPAPLARKPQA